MFFIVDYYESNVEVIKINECRINKKLNFIVSKLTLFDAKIFSCILKYVLCNISLYNFSDRTEIQYYLFDPDSNLIHPHFVYYLPIFFYYPIKYKQAPLNIYNILYP